MRRTRKGWAVIGSIVACAIIASVGCAFSSGRLVTNDDDASTSPASKHFGAFGSDTRFTWTPSEVVDRDRNLVWRRRAAPQLTFVEAAPYCETIGMRLPTRDELLEISDWFGTDLFPDTAEKADWQWSATSGARSGSAWAIGNAGYANSNDIEARSLVRCVGSP